MRGLALYCGWALPLMTGQRHVGPGNKKSYMSPSL